MKKRLKKSAAILTVVALAAALLPLRVSKSAGKKYSISETGGTYTGEVQTSVKVRNGYKVYYSTGGTFTTDKVIKSGKTKTFTLKKDTALQLIAVKKSVKATKKKLNNKWQSRVKTYVYRIDDEVIEVPDSTDTVTTSSPVATASASGKPAATATPAVTNLPVTTKAPTASTAPSTAPGGGSSGGTTVRVTTPTPRSTASGTPGVQPSGNPAVQPSSNPGVQPSGAPVGGGNSGTVTGLTAIAADTAKPAALTYDASSAVSITMTNGGSDSGTGYKMETDSDNGETVLSIKSAGTYIVSTSGSVNGRIEIKKGLGDVTLVLNGVNLTSSVTGDEGVIQCKGKDDDTGLSNNLKVIVAAGSTNTLKSTGGGEADEDDPTDTDYPAGILVKKTSTLTVGGSGTLNINATYGSGIKVKLCETDSLTDINTSAAGNSDFWKTTLTIQDSPTINISCYEDDAGHSSDRNYDAHQDAISSKNSLAIYGGTITLAAGDDGIHAEAMSRITGGTITVSRSAEGLEGARVAIDGGTISLTSSDDGINAANGDLTSDTNGEDVNIYNITINGGTVTVNAEGDGIDSNGNAFITGGTVTVYGPSSGGNGALDVADRTGSLVVSGGTLTATAGTTDMAISPSTTGLGFVAFSVDSAIAAGTTLKITDASGNTVGTLTTKKSAKWILYSGSGITNGSTYNLVSGSSTVATATAGQGTAGGGMGGGPGGGGTPPSGDMGGTPPSGGPGGPGGM